MSLLHLVNYKRQDRISEEIKKGNEFARVLLNTNNTFCKKFFNGIAPANLYRENTTRMRIERYIRQICRFNVYIDDTVEKIEVQVLKG